MDAHADVNIQENDGWTALMFAGFHVSAFVCGGIFVDGVIIG